MKSAYHEMKIDNQMFNHKRIYFLICIILFSIFVISCGGVSLDDLSGIDQTNKIGYFSKYGYMDGAPQWTIEYFEEFGKIFPTAFYNRTGNQITPLKSNALVRKNGKIDIIASAKEQGFDIVVETRVSCVSSAQPLGTDVTAQNHMSITDVTAQNHASAADVEAKSQYYFDKHASELTHAEAARLADLTVPNLKYYDPSKQPDTAQNHAFVTDVTAQNHASVTDVAVQNHASVVVTRVSDKKILWDSSAFRFFGPYSEEQCSYYICKMELLKKMASTMAEGLVKSEQEKSLCRSKKPAELTNEQLCKCLGLNYDAVTNKCK